MNKILISIKPEWTAKILNGEKTIEVRKTAPKCDLPCEVYIYCTRGDYLHHNKYGWFVTDKPITYIALNGRLAVRQEPFNGKVVLAFTLLRADEFDMGNPYEEPTSSFLKKACVTIGQARTYANGKRRLYAWHISDLVIFDGPRELSEFVNKTKFDRLYNELNDGVTHNEMTAYMTAKAESVIEKAPQSWCYVEVRE